MNKKNNTWFSVLGIGFPLETNEDDCSISNMLKHRLYCDKCIVFHLHWINQVNIALVSYLEFFLKSITLITPKQF